MAENRSCSKANMAEKARRSRPAPRPPERISFPCFNTQYSAVAIKEQNGGQENKQKIQEEMFQVKPSTVERPLPPALPQTGSVAKAHLALGLVGETGLSHEDGSAHGHVSEPQTGHFNGSEGNKSPGPPAMAALGPKRADPPCHPHVPPPPPGGTHTVGAQRKAGKAIPSHHTVIKRE